MTERQDQLAEAQQVAHLGSWERNLITGKAIWSDEFYRLLGLDFDVEPGPDAFLARVHPDDRALVEAGLEATRDRRRRLGIRLPHRARRWSGSVAAGPGDADVVRQTGPPP